MMTLSSAARTQAKPPPGNPVQFDVGQVVEVLLDRGVPFILHTGAGVPSGLQKRCPETPVQLKPVTSEVLVRFRLRL